MNDINLQDSIQFSKLMSRGYNPAELFEKVYTEREKEVYQSVNRAAIPLILKQKEMGEDVSRVINSIESLEALKPSQEMLEALKLKKVQLREVIERLNTIISQTTLQIEDKRTNIAALEEELSYLRVNLIKAAKLKKNPALLELGEFLCKNTSLSTKEKFENGS